MRFSRRGLTGRVIVNILLWIIFVLLALSAITFFIRKFG
jgi:hypothetical protein